MEAKHSRLYWKESKGLFKKMEVNVQSGRSIMLFFMGSCMLFFIVQTEL